MEAYVRKMASIQEINGVYPIEGADKICQYGIQGWRVVDQVDKYQVGDLVVFAEVDSWIPTSIASFLSKGKEPREYNGIKGEKLRTIRLRKALSQGLILPLSVCDYIDTELFIGLDVSYPLGIVKWEAPPEFKSADAKGSFPSFIFKTDQERCLSAETLIETNIGLITIKEIVDNKLEVLVESYNVHRNQIEKQIVSGWSVNKQNKNNSWLKITTISGKQLIVTENHKIWSETIKKYVLASDLKIDDYLLAI